MNGSAEASATRAGFAFNRERFAQATRKGFGELEGLEVSCEGGIAVALSRRFHDAIEAGAISGPAGVEVIVYAVEDSVIVAVREGELPRNLSVPMRQLATYSFETKSVVDGQDGSFDEACEAIEELLRRAGELLPSFAALRAGERKLGPGGRWRLLKGLRRLVTLQ